MAQRKPKKEILKNNAGKHQKNDKKQIKKVNKTKKTEISEQQEKHLKKARKPKFKVRHPKLAKTLKIVIPLIITLIIVGVGVSIGVLYGAYKDEFEISLEDLIIKNENSYIVDQEGNIIAELSGPENRKIITLDQMSPYLADAYVSIEDERFYQHKGVDLYRTSGAIVTYVLNRGSSSFGGSTITQQLVKNFTDDRADKGMEGILRKVKEWVKSYKVEQMLSKLQILELYLNLIPVGGEQYGVETGAIYYFNKSASELSLVECAFLAGINNAPSTYNPYGQYGYGVYDKKTTKINNKVKVVLGKMLELEKISKEEYDEAIKVIDEGQLKFENGNSSRTYSYHTDALLNQVINDIAKEKGISKSLAEQYIYSNGLKIYSTQVGSIQEKTENAVNNAYRQTSKYEDKEKDEEGNWITVTKEQTTQSAMVVIDHKTGYVVSCVGGIGEKVGKTLNRATQSVRQPGSSIKPIAVVAPGLEEKIITGATIYNDEYTEFVNGTSIFKPKNWNHYRGNITIRQSIETSQNVPFVKALTEIGVEKSIEYLEKMGISSLDKNNEGLALAIGGLTNGISPLEMAGAYAMIANDGVYIQPTFYTKIEDKDGNVVLTAKQESRRVISETTAAILKNLLKEPVYGAGGSAGVCAVPGIDTAAKTGTTNKNKDRWLCGFTPYYTAATWYGYDHPAEVTASGVRTANTIWGNAMKAIHKELPNAKFTLTSNIVSARICMDSGKLASDTCTHVYSEIFEKGTIPQSCEGHTEYKICNESNLLANDYCTSTRTELKIYLSDKEKTGNWKTEKNVEENEIPTEICTIHKKPEPVVPENPDKPIEDEKDDTNTDIKDSIDTDKPEDGKDNEDNENNEDEENNNNENESGNETESEN